MLSYKDTKVSKLDCFNYSWQNIAANYIGFFLNALILKLLLGAGASRASILLQIIFPVLTLLLPPAVLIFFLKKKISDHYIPNSPENTVIKSFLLYVIPSELVRFIICIVPAFGKIHITLRFGIAIASPANILFGLYLSISGRTQTVNNLNQCIFWDFFAYAVAHLIYLALYMFLVFIIYRFYWNRAAEEHKELTRYQREI